MDTQLLRQKTVYDKKIHGNPYKEDDQVATFNSGPKGKLKKTAPLTVVKRLQMVRRTKGRHKWIVVHFDRLKPCSSLLDQDITTEVANARVPPSPEPRTDNQIRTMNLMKPLN